MEWLLGIQISASISGKFPQTKDDSEEAMAEKKEKPVSRMVPS
jgi:hypothetical protein